MDNIFLGFLLVTFAIFQSNCDKKNIEPPVPPPVVEQLPQIVWNNATRKQIAFPEASNPGYYSYPRIIELQNGNLLSAFEHKQAIYTSESTDAGKTWTDQQLIADRKDNIAATVPELIQTRSGKILLAYNLRPNKNPDGTYDPAKKFAIAIRQSTDLGKTWTSEKVLYSAGHEFTNGCWEPAMVELPNGEVHLYFANEGPYTNSNEQEISVIISKDEGNTWLTKADQVSFAPQYRDGMPVPYYDHENHRVLLAIEDNSYGAEFKPSIISLALPWDGQSVGPNSSNRIKPLDGLLASSVYAGAPYLRRFRDGTWVLSMQSTNGRTNVWNMSDMQVAIGKRLDSMYLTSKPFQMGTGSSALWNSVCVLKNDSIIAVSSTNAFTPYTSIWMVKGKLVKN